MSSIGKHPPLGNGPTATPRTSPTPGYIQCIPGLQSKSLCSGQYCADTSMALAEGGLNLPQTLEADYLSIVSSVVGTPASLNQHVFVTDSALSDRSAIPCVSHVLPVAMGVKDEKITQLQKSAAGCNHIHRTSDERRSSSLTGSSCRGAEAYPKQLFTRKDGLRNVLNE